MTSANRLAVLSCAALVASTAAGCASATKVVTGGGSDSAITLGTTNVTKVLDPAGTYDAGSWMVLNNTFQSLLKFPAGATVPQPDVAQSCAFTGADTMTYSCTLKSGVKFSNGHPLTAQDVVFSITRMLKINDPSGPAALLSTIKSVQAKGDTEVTFHLKTPDAVLPAKLASAAGSIVDHAVFPADKLLSNDKLVGSGPYKIDSIDDLAGAKAGVPGKISFSANSQYTGDEKMQNNKFVLRFYADGEKLKSALDSGEIDVTDNNSLDPAIATKLRDDEAAGKSSTKVTEGDSGEVSFLVFNTKDSVTGNPAVRQAIAQVIDRQALVSNVFQHSVQPLYSVVPAGVAGHNTAFFDKYGEPDVNKAKKILTSAHVSLPVKLSLTWSRARAGDAQMAETKKQLEASGLFQVDIQKEPDWQAFQDGWKAGKYQMYAARWVPDYVDADDFISPLVVDGGAYHNGWDDPRISQQLVPDGIKQTDRGAAVYGQMQNIIADAAPLIPLYQNKSFYASKAEITGVTNTVDTSGIIRFWEIGRTKK
ncbi:ABC transporter substrate-binding protein [Kitasatospora sp. NPDC002227]|uniref:ABC transporter substrate-binding protein n=1 Tax=Kitasatospora sp. NPDC002227 TaxID=3154773 RepID=UPI00331711C4